MRFNLTLITALITACTLAACTAPFVQQPTSTIDAVVIRNMTSHMISNVVLKIPATGKVVSCSTILPHRECSLGFPLQENKHNPATLSWQYQNRVFEESLAGRPSAPDTTPQQAIITIIGEGLLKAKLTDHVD